MKGPASRLAGGPGGIDSLPKPRGEKIKTEMTAVDQRQAAIYRRMTPQERLAQATRLWWQGRHLAAAAVRARHPAVTDAEARRLLARLFLMGHE